MRKFVLSGALVGSVLGFEPPACRWVEKFDASIFQNPDSVEYASYVDNFLRGEAQWIRGLGTEPNQGWTLDGQRLDVETGRPVGDPHNWTASSKECMQMFLIARILYDSIKGNLCQACSIWTREEALDLLRKKMAAYKQFDDNFPGFGGFFPWMKIDLKTGDIRPDGPNWDNHVPSLDNAELLWPLWAVAEVLDDLYPGEEELRAAVRRSVDLMLTNSRTVFYNATVPGIRTESFFTDQTRPVAENTYAEGCVDGVCRNFYLDDPYEGELFLDAIAAFPREMGFTQEEVRALWEAKKPKTKKASVDIGGTTYETEQGWTFSSHEKWKYLMMPYLESTLQQNVFYSGEKIRTMYANEMGYAGLWGAMTGPTLNNQMDPGYHASVGIPSLASQNISRFDLVTPYGAYALILANQAVGMAWLHNMISAPAGQNCFGTTEGFRTDGTVVSAYVTWDTKITNVMALLGGIGDIVHEYLVKGERFDALLELWDDQWAEFTADNLAGFSISEFELPKHSMPRRLPDFTSCDDSEKVCEDEPDSSTAVIGFSLVLTVFVSLFVSLG